MVKVNMSFDSPDSEQDRRMNLATSNPVNAYNNSSPNCWKYAKASSSFNTLKIDPNTSRIMPNTSLAPLNSATSSSAGASVIGKLLNNNSVVLEVLNLQNERLLAIKDNLLSLKVINGHL